MQYCKICLIMLLPVVVCFGLEPAKASLKPCRILTGDEVISAGTPVPYHQRDRQSPGDSIGTTYYDYQENGTFGQRLGIDDLGQAHINWMKRNAAGDSRFCAWNARFADGTYYGEAQASVSWSGYVQLDITRDLNPDSQRTVVAYHYKPAAEYYGYIDIDAGNVWGNWPNNPKTPASKDDIWPYIAVANNGNIVMITNHFYSSPQASHIKCFLTTDEGDNWTNFYQINRSGANSQFIRSSRNPGSNKMVICWTQHISDSAFQLDNDVYYMVSTDGGVNWGDSTNITHYGPADTIRAYADVNAIFDANDNLHIVWSGMRVHNGAYMVASKIFHWDEVSDQISIVTYPSIYYTGQHGWWTAFIGQADPGGWRLPADQPQLVCEPDSNWLYCLWHGQDDPADKSAAGFQNGDFYMTMSKDNGLTWTDTAGNAMYDSLTHTRSPGAGPGECMDEDYMTANPYVVNNSIWITYIEDKDAGAACNSEGIYTSNPVRCWIFHVPTSGVEEYSAQQPMIVSMNIAPNPFKQMTDIRYQITEYQRQEVRGKKQDISLKIYDISGRVVQQFDNKTIRLSDHISWHGTDARGHKVPAGVYFVHLKTENKSITAKIIKLR